MGLGRWVGEATGETVTGKVGRAGGSDKAGSSNTSRMKRTWRMGTNSLFSITSLARILQMYQKKLPIAHSRALRESPKD